MKVIAINEKFEFSEPLTEDTAITIGFFDGVHSGHRFLIEQLKKVAQDQNLPSAVITFPVHPRKVLHSDYQPELLNTLEEKLQQLATTEVDYCLVLDFTENLSQLSAKEFIQEKLAKCFRAKTILIGYDHKFGKGRADGFDEYKQYGNSCGIEVIHADSLSEEDFHVSSTTIRNFLKAGKVKDAASILTYNYTLNGIVVSGNKMGREMGFPTANIELSEKDKIIPQDGIYATLVHADDQIYKGMTYIGTRPSLFSQGELRIEVNILDFEGDLYGKNIKVEFIDFIREDKKFERIEVLKKQLFHDMKITRERLSEKI